MARGVRTLKKSKRSAQKIKIMSIFLVEETLGRLAPPWRRRGRRQSANARRTTQSVPKRRRLRQGGTPIESVACADTASQRDHTVGC